jgi:hypothetical protein
MRQWRWMELDYDQVRRRESGDENSASNTRKLVTLRMLQRNYISIRRSFQ